MTAATPASGWRKAEASGNSGNCVEVKITQDGVLVRNSRDSGRGSELAFTRTEWAAFLDGARNREFDLSD